MESSGVRQLLGPRSIWNTGEAEAIGPIVNEVDGIRMIPPADDEVPLGHVNLAVASEEIARHQLVALVHRSASGAR